MLIKVAFGGKKLFEWEGGPDAIARIDDEALRIAKLGNVSPEALAQSMIRHISRKGGFCAPNSEAEMILVTWLLISQPTNNPDRPGLIRDYLDAWNFDFDIRVNPDGRSFKFIATTSGFTAKGTA
ncbi:hypothetical protein [Bradyrhizobium diazoefficiens]